MSDENWINQTLMEYLKRQEFSSYHKLINLVINSNDIDAKYNLFTLFMESETEKSCIDNLRKLIGNLYCKDSNLESYLDKIIHYNPKFNTVSISASHKLDMHGDFSQYLDFYLQDNSIGAVEHKIRQIKEVLRMIIIETKIVRL